VAPKAIDARLKSLMALRLVLITTLLLIAVVVEAISETLSRINPLYFVVVATYALTILYAVSLRVLSSPSALVWLQMGGDLLVITALVYVTGGSLGRGGFILLYPLCVLAGSILLASLTAGLVLATVTTLLYVGMVVAVRSALVVPVGLADTASQSLHQVGYSAFLLWVACALVAAVGSFMSQALANVGAELVRATEQVADLQGLNDAMLESLNSGLIAVDAAGCVLWINAYGERLLGCSSSELRGRTAQEGLATPLLEAASLRARIGHPDLHRLEFDYVRKDSTTLRLGCSVSALKRQGDSGLLLAFQDLTRIKSLEFAVRDKEKLAAVGEMAAQLAHEIRNPLASISGSAQVLLSDAALPSEQLHLLAIIRKESKRLSDALNRFLLDNRSAVHRPGPVDVRGLLAEAWQLLSNSAEVGQAHLLEFVAQPVAHLAAVDPDRLMQVFWNLTRNGLEAMPLGGTLRVELRCLPEEIAMLVSDQGRGFAPEQGASVFKPLARAGQGGLGLAIVYRIVREHGGDIHVESAPGRGTTVEVRLPRVSSHSSLELGRAAGAASR